MDNEQKQRLLDFLELNQETGENIGKWATWREIYLQAKNFTEYEKMKENNDLEKHLQEYEDEGKKMEQELLAKYKKIYLTEELKNTDLNEYVRRSKKIEMLIVEEILVELINV